MKNNKKNNYIIQVAPMLRLPILRTQVFSYLHQKPLSPGTLVSVPFYMRYAEGIVIESNEDFKRKGSIKLKKIRTVIEKKLLTENQIKLAQKISSYYLSSLGVILKAMVPRRVGIKKREALNDSSRHKEKVEQFPVAKKTARQITKSRFRKFLLINRSSNEKNQIYIKLAAEFIKKNKQCLILVSEVYQALNVYEKWRRVFNKKDIAVVHSQIPKGQLYNYWKEIKKGKVKIIIGSKLSVFLPFKSLGLIVVDEEQDASHKQWDAHPRYNARKAAEFLADLFKAKLVLSSSSPSVETFWRTSKKEIQLVQSKDRKEFAPQIIIVDALAERRNHDFPISQALYKELTGIIKNGKQAILFVNRRGFSSFTVCRSCNEVLRCPKCDRALVYFNNKEQYQCLHCSYKMNLLNSCPVCGGFRFSHFGFGAEKVEKKLKDLFPSAKIARLDSGVMRSPRKYKQIYDRFLNNEIDILVGTQVVLKSLDVKNVRLVGIISASDFMRIPDYNSREKALANFIQAVGLISSKDLKNNAAVIVQTTAPRDSTISYLKNIDYEKFYQEEIKLRKKFSYPPFSKLIKISCRDKKLKEVEKETRRLFDLISSDGDNKIEVSRPYNPIVPQKRGRYYRNILVKVKSEKEIQDLRIYPILAGLGKNCAVDVDPMSTA